MIKKAFAQFDRDGDGTVSSKELITLSLTLALTLTVTLIR